MIFRGRLLRGTIVLFSILILASCSNSKKLKSSDTNRNPTSGNETTTSKNNEILLKYSSKLGVDRELLESEKLYLFIDQWEGVPYKYGGNTTAGADCSGFVGVLYRNVYSKELPRTTSEISNATKSVSVAQLREGDLVFFDINGKKSSHVGVYLHNGKFIHASTSKGVIISDLAQQYYKDSFSKGGRL